MPDLVLRRVPGLLLSCALLAAACGQSLPAAPLITSLVVSPSGPLHPADALRAEVTFVDEGSDLSGGHVEFGLRRVPDDAEGSIYELALTDVPTGVRRGVVAVNVVLPATALPGHYEISLTLIDSAMRRSNSLVGAVDVTD